MPVIYETIYIPFENNIEGNPWKYSGSDLNDNPRYFGSPCDTRIMPWTDNLSVREWWKREVRLHPQKFRKTVLIQISKGFVARHSIKVLESQIQTAEDHAGNAAYFNRTNRKQGAWLISKKGKTYEEIYGVEKSLILKRTRGVFMKNRVVSPESIAKLKSSIKGRKAPNKNFPMSDEQKIKLSKAKKGCTAWNKGMSGIYSDEQIKAIKKVRARQNMGMWVTNGEVNRKVYDGEVPDGFYKGRVMTGKIVSSRASQNMGMWVTDGVVSLKVYDGEIPDGFRQGRVFSKKGKKNEGK